MRTEKEIKKEIAKVKRIDRDFPSNDWCKDTIIILEWVLGKEWPESFESMKGNYPKVMRPHRSRQE